MQAKRLFQLLISTTIFLVIYSFSFAQENNTIGVGIVNKKPVEKHLTTLLRDELNSRAHLSISQQVCSDTVYSVLQSAPYFCYDGICDPFIKLYFEISGSMSAAATADSAIVWLMTDDKDESGPLSSLPDSMVPGKDIRQSHNRARWIDGTTPMYISNTTATWITPYSFEYVLPPFWASTGRAICFTPIAWDSTYNGSLFEKDNCFGYGKPIQKIVLPGIRADHFFSCDSNGNSLHLVVKGGLPQYNFLNGYGNSAVYDVSINSTQYSVHYKDTLVVPADDINYISITDTLSTNGLADGCLSFEDTVILHPSLNISNLPIVFLDNETWHSFSVSPKPTGAMRINFLTSDPASDGIYLLNANGDTVYSRYPLGLSVGTGNIANIHSSIYIYDIPLTGAPFRIVATNDNGSGWRDFSCLGLLYNGHLQVFDLATGDTLSGILFPDGDGVCGTSGNMEADTFGVFNLAQYNKTELSINGNPLSLSGVDSAGNAYFSPYVAGPGSYQITFTYNDTRSNLCDMDTVITLTVDAFVGINNLNDEYGVLVNNPVHDLLQIKSKIFKISYLEILDVTGKLILSRNLSKVQTVDLTPVAQGVYFVKLFDDQHSLITTKKIIKE